MIKGDEKPILKILKGLDLFYPALSLKDFQVAEKDGKVVACVQLEEHDNFKFLGSLAVAKELQGQGIGNALMRESLKAQKKNTYLYTIIPGFFKKFGFNVPDTHPPNLPSKDQYGCGYCHPEKCVCMVKYAHAS